jgi:hypothetical protein
MKRKNKIEEYKWKRKKETEEKQIKEPTRMVLGPAKKPLKQTLHDALQIVTIVARAK